MSLDEFKLMVARAIRRGSVPALLRELESQPLKKRSPVTKCTLPLCGASQSAPAFIRDEADAVALVLEQRRVVAPTAVLALLLRGRRSLQRR